MEAAAAEHEAMAEQGGVRKSKRRKRKARLPTGAAVPADALWKIADVARFVGLTEDWVYRHVNEIPSVKFGNKRRFRPEDVRRWVEKQSKPGA